jgi:hypothetical protein
MYKFGCGCIGFPIDDSKYLCILTCDYDDIGYRFMIRRRTPQQEKMTKLTEDEIQRECNEINKAISKGYAYDSLRFDIKNLLSGIE